MRDPAAFSKLGLHEAVHVSELLEIPTPVANTDLLGPFASSMAPLIEKRLGPPIVAIPVKLPVVPIYMIWHEARRSDTAHCWLRELVEAEVCRFASG